MREAVDDKDRRRRPRGREEAGIAAAAAAAASDEKVKGGAQVPKKVKEVASAVYFPTGACLGQAGRQRWLAQGGLGDGAGDPQGCDA